LLFLQDIGKDSEKTAAAAPAAKDLRNVLLLCFFIHPIRYEPLDKNLLYQNDK
jgi:hypothetical protein